MKESSLSVVSADQMLSLWFLKKKLFSGQTEGISFRLKRSSEKAGKCVNCFKDKHFGFNMWSMNTRKLLWESIPDWLQQVFSCSFRRKQSQNCTNWKGWCEGRAINWKFSRPHMERQAKCSERIDIHSWVMVWPIYSGESWVGAKQHRGKKRKICYF